MDHCEICIEEHSHRPASARDGKIAGLIVLALFIGVAIVLNLYSPKNELIIFYNSNIEKSSVVLGLIDGLSICNLSLVALLVSLAYTSGIPRSKVALLATAFLGAQAFVYFLLGLGILNALKTLMWVSDIPRYMVTRVTASIMLVLGGVVLVNAIKPGYIWLPSPPESLSRWIRYFIYSKGFIGVALAGALLALHNMPCACSGSIYITFLSIISGSEEALTTLLTYIILYLVPSATILLASLNKYTYNYITQRLSSGRILRATIGGLMIAIASTFLLII